MKNANQALLGVAMVGLLGGSMMATSGSGSAEPGAALYSSGTDVPIGTDPVPSTTVPGPTTTAPGPTTTDPGPTTTAPGPTTTAPGPTTTAPGPTTTDPGPTTTAPGPTTSAPGPTTTAPGPTTTAPGPTTTAPGPTTTAPGPTTTVPGPTTTLPGPTTTTTTTTTTTIPVPRVLSLGDLIWLDLNGDGRRDGDESGLPGVQLVARYLGADGLPGGGDDEVFRATTDGEGAYLIQNLPAGIYEITVDSGLPGGVVATFDPDSGTAAPDGATRLNLTASNFDQDFGYRYTSSIGDTVYRDLNRNGAQDPGEPGIQGVTMLLTRNDGVSFRRTRTGSDGHYLFASVAPGTYAVVIDLGRFPEDGLVLTDEEDGTFDGNSVVVLGANDNHLTADFGYAKRPQTGTASIGDLVYLDLNGDGNRDAGEPGVGSQLVKLTEPGPDGVIGSQDDTTKTATTDGSGAYLFGGLPDGQYVVMIVGGIADTAGNTADPDGGVPNLSNVTIANELDDLDQDFGYHAPVVSGGNTIGDTVWFDENGNGVDDPGEQRLSGVDVTVTWLGPDRERGGGDDVLIGVFTTDGDGKYLATQLPDGRFSVDVTGGVPTIFMITFDPQGSTDPDGLSTVTVSGGKSNIDQDFGYTAPALPLLGSIGDTVFYDRNRDGSQDRAAGEQGLSGVTVTLTSPNGTARTTSTNSDGMYLFDTLPAGDYTVRVDVATVPPGLVNSADPDAASGTVGDSQSTVQLAMGEHDRDQDFGYGPPAPVGGTTGVGDTVWVDTNGNGVRDALEPGIHGLEITVKSAGNDGVFGTADDVVRTTVTDSSGHYFVDGLPPGPAMISYDPDALPAGLSPSFDADGGTGPQAAVTTVVLVADAPDRSVDFAVGGTASIRGVVFNDHNRNGVLDPGETGVPGAVVTVTCQSTNGPIVMRAVTGHDGSWSLSNLPAGTCRVTVPGAPPRIVTLTGGHSTDLTIGVLGSGGGTGTPPPGSGTPPPGSGTPPPGSGTPPQQPGSGTPPALPDTGTNPLVLLLLALGLVLAGSVVTWSPRISSRLIRAWNGESRTRD